MKDGWKRGDKCGFKHDPKMKGKKAAPSSPRGNNAKATPAIVGDFDDVGDMSFKVAPTTVKNDKKVKFDNRVQNHEYEKLDYVECKRQRKKNMNAEKETKTLQQLRHDMQWILQCKLGATRGRAMAMLIDSEYEYKDLDEAHIVIGPKIDRKLKPRLRHDEDLEHDPSADLFEI